MTNILDGKVAIVTGSNRGIGRQIVETFAENGCKSIFACARKKTNKFVDDIRLLERRTGISVNPVYFDLSNQDEVTAAAKEIRRDKDNVPDILVNCAGILSEYRRFNMMPIEDAKHLFDIDYWGQIAFTQHILKIMQRHRAGSVVFISSIAGMDGFFSSFDYVACKAAINATVIQLAREYGGVGIRVNAVAPGLIETDMISDKDEGNLNLIKGDIMLHRFGTKQEIADVVSFLVSDLASYITGQIIRVDGGSYGNR